MANKQINELTELTSADSTDWMLVYDNDEAGSEKTKKIAVSNIAGLPNNWIDGFIMSNAGDAENMDITVGPGQAMDSTNSYSLTVTGTMTKQLDASWAAGDDAGGLFHGSVDTETCYHFFAIRKDSDGSIDFGFDTDVTASGIPNGYTAYRRLGAVITTTVPEIRGFKQIGDVFKFDTAPQDKSGLGTSMHTISLSVPTGLEVSAIIHAKFSDYSPVGATYVWVRGEHEKRDAAPAVSDSELWVAGTSSGHTAVARMELITSTSGQIYARASQWTGDHRFYVDTHGWVDPRGKNGQ